MLKMSFKTVENVSVNDLWMNTTVIKCLRNVETGTPRGGAKENDYF